jgi:hypothetical protein
VVKAQMSEYIDSLFPIVAQNYNEIKQVLGQIHIESRAIKLSKGTMYLFMNFNEEARKQFKIDDALSMYLLDISDSVLPNFYKMVACLLQLFRNCMN